jgi:DNA-binding transcriptional LysR family regulator
MGDFNALMIFATVAKAKSFSEAARRLKMPLASVSRRVADLEGQLGVRLLERSTRNLRLTEVGAEVLEHAQRSLEICDAVDSIVSNHRDAVSGVLRVSAPPNISDSLLAPLLCAFRVSYPKVRVQALITERYVDHIADGVDLAFRVGVLKDASLVARKLLTYRHRLVASPEYLKKVDPPQNPGDLQSHPDDYLLILEAGDLIYVRACEYQDPGDGNIPAVPDDERFCGTHARAACRRGNW